ncbi:unnamed protein product, partial [marine sediment metagenome]
MSILYYNIPNIFHINVPFGNINCLNVETINKELTLFIGFNDGKINIVSDFESLSVPWKTFPTTCIKINKHQDSIYQIRYRDNQLLTCSRDKSVVLWDVSKNKCIKKYEEKTIVWDCCFYKNSIIYGTEDGMINIVNIKNNTINNFSGFYDFLESTIFKTKSCIFSLNTIQYKNSLINPTKYLFFGGKNKFGIYHL